MSLLSQELFSLKREDGRLLQNHTLPAYSYPPLSPLLVRPETALAAG